MSQVVAGLSKIQQGLPQLLDGVCTHKRFYFVRMKRSAHPVPSGAHTKAAGELAMPRKAIPFWKASDMYCDPVIVTDGQTKRSGLCQGSGRRYIGIRKQRPSMCSTAATCSRSTAGDSPLT